MLREDYGLTNFALEDLLELRDNHILVREDQPDDELMPSGLYAPQVAMGPGHYRLATVLKVGPGFRTEQVPERVRPYVRHPVGCNKIVSRGWRACSCGLDGMLSGERDPLDVVPGDRVLLGRHYAGDPIIVEGTVHILCREDDVVGILTPQQDPREPVVCTVDRSQGDGTVRVPLTLSPLADRVLVDHRPDLHELHSTLRPAADTGLVLSDNAKGQTALGQVLTCGPGWGARTGARLQMLVRPGDYVLFRGDTGQDVRIGGKMFWMMRESEILGVCDLEGRM